MEPRDLSRRTWLQMLGAFALFPSVRLAAQGPAAATVEMIGESGEAARYWPRWPGPSGQGLAAHGPYPEHLVADRERALEGPRFRGRETRRRSSGRTASSSPRQPSARQEPLRALLKPPSGKLLWESPSHKAEGASRQERLGLRYADDRWRASTPNFGMGGLYCCDMEGKQVWHVTFPPMSATCTAWPVRRC